MKALIYTIIISLATLSCVNLHKQATVKKEGTKAGKSKSIALVDTARLRLESIDQAELYMSSLLPNASYYVSPTFGTRIEAILADEGSKVRAGQLLVKMNSLNYNKARLKYQNDLDNFDKIRALYKIGGVSKSDYQKAKLGINIEAASLKDLKNNTFLRTKISGVVVKKNYDLGNIYNPALPILIVQNMNPIKLNIAIAEQNYSKIHKNDKVDVCVEALGNKHFKAKINRISPSLDPYTHSLNVELLIDNKDLRLRPGMTAKVKLDFAKKRVLLVPQTAVVMGNNPSEKTVFVLNKNNTISEVKLRVSDLIGDKYLVLDGLKPGQIVVTNSQLQLKNGMQVKPVNR